MTEIKQGAANPPTPEPRAEKPDAKPVEHLEHGSRDRATKPGVPSTSQNFGEPKWAT